MMFCLLLPPGTRFHFIRDFIFFVSVEKYNWKLLKYVKDDQFHALIINHKKQYSNNK